MLSSDWWQADLPEKFDQGDVFTDVPFIMPAFPTTYLAHTNLKGGKAGWEEKDEPKPAKDGKLHFLGVGPQLCVMILNHGCDIDKAKDPKRARILVAQVSTLSSLNPQQQAVVSGRESKAMLYLPDVPSIGDAFADFRLITTVPRLLLDSKTRVGSMQIHAQEFLQAQLLTFFTRKEVI